MHYHQLHKGHMRVFESLEVLTIEDFLESSHNSCYLNVIEAIRRLLVLVLETL